MAKTNPEPAAAVVAAPKPVLLVDGPFAGRTEIPADAVYQANNTELFLRHPTAGMCIYQRTNTHHKDGSWRHARTERVV
jgi:hypothetical protein